LTVVLALLMALLIAAAVPIAHSILIAAVAAIFAFQPAALLVVPQQLLQSAQTFPLVAIPFFILAGALMLSGRMGEHLMSFASGVVGRRPGGLAQASVVAATVFGGVSGSAVAAASALGSTMIPWQRREGYPAPFCAALNSSAATIDILIPPSIPLILYALVSNVSIGALFFAGILPGLALMAGFLVLCGLIARRRGFPRGSGPRVPLARAFRYASPALAMPVFIVVTLRFGLVTPTEIAVLAVAYALVVSGLVYRDLTWARLRGALVAAATTTGVVMLVIMAAGPAGWIMTFERIPVLFTEWALTVLQEKWLIILAMNLVMLAVGTFLDLPPAILLLGPVFVPLAQAIGLDLVQLGVMMVLNLAIGLYTPPVGTTLFVSCVIARVRMGETMRDLLPFFLFSLGLLAMVSFLPALTLK
jgi:tripartite ATP-independent transporter DctM subunit